MNWNEAKNATCDSCCRYALTLPYGDGAVMCAACHDDADKQDWRNRAEVAESALAEMTKKMAIMTGASAAAEKLYEERLNSAMLVAFGLAMKKAKIGMLVIDPARMTSFNTKDVTVSPAANGKVRYRLLTHKKDGDTQA